VAGAREAVGPGSWSRKDRQELLRLLLKFGVPPSRPVSGGAHWHTSLTFPLHRPAPLPSGLAPIRSTEMVFFPSFLLFFLLLLFYYICGPVLP